MEENRLQPKSVEDAAIYYEKEEDEDLHVEYDIAVYPSDYTLKLISEMWEKNDIDLPEFQRQFVWSINQASQLIESFLIGLPVPPVFFYIDEEYRNLVVDGQQRIMSVVYFFSGYFGKESQSGKRTVFRLKGISEKSPFHNLRFEDLKDSDKRKLENSVLRAINVRQVMPKKDSSSIFHIFERLNTGGTPLRPQEIRNCVYHGQIVEELRKLNEFEAWRNIIDRPNPEKHQRDVEIILRIFAFWDRWEEYEKPMKRFLNYQMSKYKCAQHPKFEDFKRNFEIAVEFFDKHLEKKPFHIRGPINLAALDSVACLTIRNVDNLPEDFSERFKVLIADDSYREAIFYSTSDSQSVASRMRIANKILFES